MTLLRCTCKRDCTAWAVIASIVFGILAAFLQITAVIALTTALLVAAIGIAVVYLAIILVVSVLRPLTEQDSCLCTSVSFVLAGILGTVLTAIVLLLIPFAATSIPGAIIVGLLAAGFTLILTASACLVLCLFGCNN